MLSVNKTPKDIILSFMFIYMKKMTVIFVFCEIYIAKGVFKNSCFW
jgi:hypothetical protein